MRVQNFLIRKIKLDYESSHLTEEENMRVQNFEVSASENRKSDGLLDAESNITWAWRGPRSDYNFDQEGFAEKGCTVFIVRKNSYFQ